MFVLRKGKAREGKGREGKGREGKEGKGREGVQGTAKPVWRLDSENCGWIEALFFLCRFCQSWNQTAPGHTRGKKAGCTRENCLFGSFLCCVQLLFGQHARKGRWPQSQPANTKPNNSKQQTATTASEQRQCQGVHCLCCC